MQSASLKKRRKRQAKSQGKKAKIVDSTSNALEWVIHPIDVNYFSNNYFERKILCVSRASPDYFQQKDLTLSALWDLLSKTDLYWGVHGSPIGGALQAPFREQKINKESVTKLLEMKQGCVHYLSSDPIN
jgi:hypothetical protein